MNSKEIRKKYVEFFISKLHKNIGSASIIPINDPSLLFVNSGMSPLVPYLAGEKHPEGTRLVNSQKCFRAEDINDIGDNRHNTFFEMLGNWSLGDYFKKEQLEWWYEFLISELSINPKRLYQTVYAGNKDLGIEKDEESISIIKGIFEASNIVAEVGPDTLTKGELGPGVEINFEKVRIMGFQDKNWWQRGDTTGELGGPDSETFYDTGKKHDKKFGEYCHFNCDCGRFIEIGNSVFMQYKRTEDGWEELPDRNVDFGGGLVRLAMIKQNKNNVFETDLFINIINKIEELSGKRYSDYEKEFEIIADHLNAAVFLIGDDMGVSPSNTDQGYFVRRLIRRAIRFARNLEISEEKWMESVAKIVIEKYKDVYDELFKNSAKIISEFNEEEVKFKATLERGMDKFSKLKTRIEAEGSKTITGIDVFDLYQTYGFPPEMTVELAAENGLDVNINEYSIELKKHQELSRAGSEAKFKGGLADTGEETARLHSATHLMLHALRKVLGEHVEQRGSNITSERLRYDFTHTGKMTAEEKEEVEKLVNEAIHAKADVLEEEMSVDEAKKAGAIGIFESKYGNKVKVFTISDGEKIYSREICGGPHAKNTANLGYFKIKREESSSAGVRRIKAVLTGI